MSKVELNGIVLNEEESSKVERVLGEYDKLEQEIEKLKAVEKDLRLKMSICEAKIIEGLSDSDLASGEVDIKVYSMTGALKDDRLLCIQENLAPKKIGVRGTRNLLTDLIQQGNLIIKSAPTLTWLDENGYVPPLKLEEVKEDLTSMELLTLITLSVEKNGQVKRKIRNTITKK